MSTPLSPARHSEAAFETTIAQHLLDHGYRQIDSRFEVKRAIFPEEAIAFIRTTQPKEWAKLEALHAGKTAQQVLIDLCKWLDTYGILQTLRL